MALAAIAAFACSIISVTSCRFFQTETLRGSQQAGGLFRVSYRFAECINYNELPTDAIQINFTAGTEAARVFGIIACVLGGVALIVVLGLQCVTPPGRHWRMLAFLFLCSFVCQSFTFLVWLQVRDALCSRANTTCSNGIGSVCSTCATILYLLMGACLLILPPPSATAYNCPRLAGFVHNIGPWTGITRKKDFRKALRSIRWMQATVLVASVVAFAFSIEVIFDCRFVDVNSNFRNSSWSIGLYQYYYPPDGSCRTYESSDRNNALDASTKAAEAFGVLAAFFGGILVFIVGSMLLVLNFPARVYKALPFIAFFCVLSQALTFLIFKEANDTICKQVGLSCGLGAAGVLAIVGVCLYFVVMCFFFKGVNVEEESLVGEIENENEPASAGSLLVAEEGDVEEVVEESQGVKEA